MTIRYVVGDYGIERRCGKFALTLDGEDVMFSRDIEDLCLAIMAAERAEGCEFDFDTFDSDAYFREIAYGQ